MTLSVISKVVAPAIAVMIMLLSEIPAARAQGWRPPPPNPTNCTIPPRGYGCSYWALATEAKRGAAFMLGQWQYECNNAAHGRGFLAIYYFNAALVYTQCYEQLTKRKG